MQIVWIVRDPRDLTIDAIYDSEELAQQEAEYLHSYFPHRGRLEVRSIPVNTEPVFDRRSKVTGE